MIILLWSFMRPRYLTKVVLLGGLFIVQQAAAAPCRKNSPCGQLALAARQAYAAHQHEEALHKFESVYIISQSPIMLVHLGCALHALGRYEEAIAKFRQFLRQRPRSSHAQTIQEYLRLSIQQRTIALPATLPPLVDEPHADRDEFSAAISGQIRNAHAIAPPIQVTRLPAVKEQPGNDRRVRLLAAAGTISAVLASAGIIVGLGCYGSVVSLQDRFRTSGDEFSKRQLQIEAQQFENASTAGYVSGGVLLGISMGLLSSAAIIWQRNRQQNRQQPKLSLNVDVNLVGAGIEGNF